MQEPRRLVDDEDIPERVRQRLRQAAASPWVDVDTERGLARLCGAIEADMAAATAAAAAAAAGKAAWKPWALSAAGGAACALVVGGALLLRVPAPNDLRAGHALAPSAAHAPALSVAAAAEPSPSALAAAEPSPPALAAAEPSPSALAAPADVEAPPSTEPSAPATLAEPPPRKAPSPVAARHADEVAHLARARALAASDPGAALRLADEGHRTFARGILYPEREALAIDCLRRSGRTGEARARAQRFVKRFPRSPFAERMRRENGF